MKNKQTPPTPAPPASANENQRRELRSFCLELKECFNADKTQIIEAVSFLSVPGEEHVTIQFSVHPCGKELNRDFMSLVDAVEVAPAACCGFALLYEELHAYCGMHGRTRPLPETPAYRIVPVKAGRKSYAVGYIGTWNDNGTTYRYFTTAWTELPSSATIPNHGLLLYRSLDALQLIEKDNDLLDQINYHLVETNEEKIRKFHGFIISSTYEQKSHAHKG